MKSQLRKNWWKLLPLAVFLAASMFCVAQDDVPNDEPAKEEAPKVSVPKSPAENSNFVIGNEDVLAISVWKDPELSRILPVRSDGKITLPLIGELQASGKTPTDLQAEIITDLQSFISKPKVTVMVQEIKSKRFNILGHVNKPGSYLLAPPTTVVDAIAIAGGFRDFAKTKSIYVLRDDGGKQIRVPFNYKQVINGSDPEQNIELQPRDTIVVP
jgi:polysaccharide biosynthesis/export protein